MIGEIPISDACHYMDAHDTETDRHKLELEVQNTSLSKQSIECSGQKKNLKPVY